MNLAQLSAGLTICIIIPGLYLYWLWQQRELNWLLWLPPAALLLCGLLAVGVEAYVYDRAEVVSYYTTEVGLFRPRLVQQPRYYGEAWSAYAGGLAPFVAWLLVLVRIPPVRRPTHIVHFLVCLLFVYAPLVGFAVSETGRKPTYDPNEQVPPVGSKGHPPALSLEH